MEYQYLKEAIEIIKSIDDFDPREFRGCSEEEIDALNDIFSIEYTIPDAYEEFLCFGGHGIANMLRGTRFYYNDVYQMNKGKMLMYFYEQGHFFPKDFDLKFGINDQTLVFYNHQDYFIRAFYLGAVSDTDVYYYKAGMPHNCLVYQEQVFADYFLAECLKFKEEYHKLILSEDKGLQTRVRSYRKNILDTLDILQPTENQTLTKEHKLLLTSYNAINNRLYDLFNYQFITIHEGNYIMDKVDWTFSTDLVHINHQIEQTKEEGEELIAYIEWLSKYK